MPDADEFMATLGDTLRHLSVPVEPSQLARLDDHFRLLLEANRQFNLTRITDPVRAARWLYGDSAAALAWAAQRGVGVRTVLDVGSGAGFPAVPLAVLAADWQVTALEATAKKAEFVRRCADRLGIDNLEAVHAHGAHWKAERAFDLVTFKAVGALDMCLGQGRRFVAPGGHVVVYKTAPLPADEARAGQRAARRHGLSERTTFEYELSGQESTAPMALHVYTLSAPSR